VLGRWDSWGLGNNLKEMRESAKFEKRMFQEKETASVKALRNKTSCHIQGNQGREGGRGRELEMRSQK
jgi:hypothetical protein